MHLRTITLALCLLACPSLSRASSSVISVNDQDAFDNLSTEIKASVKKNIYDIRVIFSPGIYYFSERHVVMSGIGNEQINITFEGNGATIIGGGKDYLGGARHEGPFSPDYGYVTKDGHSADIWGPVHFSEGLIKVIDKNKKLCAISCHSLKSQKASECSSTYVMIPQWYMVSTYKVDRIEDGKLYFIADDLKYYDSYLCYNVNLDHGYGKSDPRFLLCNYAPEKNIVNFSSGRLDASTDIIHECQACRFFSAHTVTLRSLEIKDLNFCGNSCEGIGVLLSFYKCQIGDVSIHDCSFSGLKSSVISAGYTDNVHFYDNDIKDCYKDVINCDVNSSYAYVCNNKFISCGLSLGSTRCISVAGANYYVAGNIFENFGYCAISVGAGYAIETGGRSIGVVENNDIYYTREWLDNPECHTVMDSGAIYIYTNNDDATIRFNHIHDYSGMCDNRGIFCDDGAHHFKIYGNVITGIANSYTIDSRRVTKTEKSNMPSSASVKNNVNNTVEENVVDGPIRFVGNEHDSRCVKGKNYVIYYGNKPSFSNNLKHLESVEEDVSIQCFAIDNGIMTVSGKDIRLLKSMPGYAIIKKYFRKL